MTPDPEASPREKVAVCIPTYNQAPYLVQAIRSVLAQDYPVAEIVVSDDASTDNTEALCQAFIREVPFFRYHRQAKNVGIERNVDFVLRQATSTYIVRLDSDDRLLPGYVGHLVSAIHEFPQAAYAHGEVWEMDGEGRRTRLRTLDRVPGFRAARGALVASLRGYRVAANMVLFRREALEKVDYMRGRGNFAEDYHLSVALTRAGYGNVYVPEVLGEYRVWLDPQGVRAHRKEEELAGLVRVFEEQIEPGFREAGMSLAPVGQARKICALRHVTALDHAGYTLEEKARLESLLIELGDSLRLRLIILLIRGRLGFLWRVHWQGIDFLRRSIKKGLRFFRRKREM